MFVSVSQTDLQSKIQKLIIKACIETAPGPCSQAKTNIKYTSNTPKAVLLNKIIQVEKNFDSLFSTIILFIEQEPFSNVPMNLEVNFWHVHQGNWTKDEGQNIKDANF